MTKKKILWLVSWYPNKLSPFNGDFIKRHAEAVSLVEDIYVIYVVRDVSGSITKDVFIEKSKKGGLTEEIIYYYSPSASISMLDKFFSERKYRKLYKKAVIDYIKESGAPALCHVHVAMKAGIIACWLKNKKSIPYVLSEHWTGFLPEADDKIADKPFYLQSAWKKVITNADKVSAVSENLSVAMQKLFGLKQISVIPNVVDRSVFYLEEAGSNDTIRFIHISGLAKFKNVKAIIQAFVIVQKEYPAATFDIFGSEDEEMKTVVSDLHLEKSIRFYSEIPQQVLAGYVRHSTALILYSNYETFGCVIIEANACGIPVIVSDIPVFHETVTEGVNGTFVPANNPEALAKRMADVINNRISFNKQAIEATSLKYSYENVGKQFSNWYNEILSNG